MAQIELSGVSYAGILHDIDIAWEAGNMIGIIGPNGAGKSTLLRILAKIWTPTAGDVYACGQPLSALSDRDRARQITYLPQQLPEEIPFTVRQFVEMGRYAYRKGLMGLTPACRHAVADAMERLSLTDYAEVPMARLSGGERQRVAIARCLAQQAAVWILDEPISNLDLYYQVEILKLLRELANEGYLMIVAIHHLEFAAQFCDHLMLLHHGRIANTGTPRQVLTEQALAEVFGMTARVYTDPYSDTLRFSIPAGNPAVQPAHA